MKAVAVIPARYASTRFPAKPLANRTGKFLIQHVVENALKAKTTSAVITATDDERIAAAVRSFGAPVAMTRSDHPSGTDRVAEVAAGLDAEIIVNVQGDEPTLPPHYIDRLVERMRSDRGADMATLAAPFPAGESPDDPARVKVVLGVTGRALYFSRSRIPFVRDAAGGSGATGGSPASVCLLHLGIYAYRRDFLLRLAKLPPTPLEQFEKLEQLRVLEHGHSIAVEIVEAATQGIDTPEQYEEFVRSVRG
jgi:3-deoxy-manno-octulosonate cytidylyltransferase (CMP-KDO synthetase)